MPHYKTFDEFLSEKHAADYSGTDDDMSDSFDAWLGEFDVEEIIEMANEYGETLAARNAIDEKYV